MTDLRSPSLLDILWPILGGNHTDVETWNEISEAIRARDEQVERDTIRRVVEWLRSDRIVLSMDGSAEDVAASALEAGEWKQ